MVKNLYSYIITKVTIDDTPTKNDNEPITSSTPAATSPTTKTPPFPQILVDSTILIKNPAIEDMLNQLRNMTIKIPLMDVIKEVSPYIKTTREDYI